MIPVDFRMYCFALLAGWCGTFALAQTAVLPPEALQIQGNRNCPSVFYAGPSGGGARTQLLYPLSELPPSTLLVQQLEFRPLGNIATSAATVQLSIAMSTSPQNANTPDASFATNVPGTAIQVFSGTVSLPAMPTGSWPRPWAVAIPLQVPFVIAPAVGDKSLVIDVRTLSSTGSSAWWVEQYATVSTVSGQGSQVLAQPNCLLPNGQSQLQWSWQPNLLHPGGRLSLTMGLYPSNQPSAALNVQVFGTAAQGGSIAGQPLPTSLATFGLPTPANCQWTVEYDFGIPLTYASYSWGGNISTGSSVQIPNNAALAGVAFFTQNLALLSYPSGLQAFPSVALRFTIGDSVTPSGSVVYALGNSNATSGTVSPDGPVSVRLQ